VSFSGRHRAAAFGVFMEMLEIREMGAVAMLDIREVRP
jgi:hypothetical protein